MPAEPAALTLSSSVPAEPAALTLSSSVPAEMVKEVNQQVRAVQEEGEKGDVRSPNHQRVTKTGHPSSC